ncbi:MAG: class I SAM-dependent methyltransferase [Candidatus Omnitrophica bacterium]|nr:class I SAM-dependent methyltransferase [Candidatus Omnitrophota bacterium]
MNELSPWKNFYRKQYGGHWRRFSEDLAQQPYHVRYQDVCLASVRKAKGRVLEVGAGRGDLLLKMPPDSAELFGCDISGDNIAACADRLRRTGRPIHLCHADAEQLPYGSDSFDAVYSLSVLWYLPDYRSAVREMFRVAKPGGLVLFDMYNAWHVTTLSNHLWRILCRLAGRELGRTKMAGVSSLANVVRPLAREYHIYGNYLLLPAGLPWLKEAGNLCRFAPSMAYAMSEGPMRRLAHKLLVAATKR